MPTFRFCIEWFPPYWEYSAIVILSLSEHFVGVAAEEIANNNADVISKE